MVAASYLRKVSGVLNARVGFTIIMESAIAASKIDPQSVPDNS
jgi:hypothetical protein